MSCIQTLGGILRDCAPSMGGIAEAYIANFLDVSKVTVESDKITSITMAESKKFKPYSFRKETSQFTSTLQKNAANNTLYVQSEIQLVFGRMETAKRIEVTALSLGDLAVIVKDCNGAYWYFGYHEPVTASAGDGQTGTARADRNGYSVTLQESSPTYPYEVDAEIVADLIG